MCCSDTNCPLADAAFFGKQLNLLTDLVKSDYFRSELPELSADIQIVTKKPFDATIGSLQLCGPDHKYHHRSSTDRRIFLTFPKGAISCQSLYKALSSSLSTFPGLNTTAQLHLLTWCSLMAEDAERFGNALRLQHNVPTCTLALLLLQAIDQCYDEGVQLLINKGARVRFEDAKVRAEFCPISRCLHRFYDFTGFSNDVLVLEPHDLWRDKGRRLANILIALVSHPDFGNFKSEKVETSESESIVVAGALNMSALVALFAGDQALKLIEAPAMKSFLADCDFPFSPLKFAFIHTMLAYQLHDEEAQEPVPLLPREDIARMLWYSVIPLVRAGARCDKLFKLRQLPDFLRHTIRGKAMSEQLWATDHDIIVDLVVEGMPTCTMVRPREMQGLRHLTEEEMDYFDAIRWRYPRSLQTTCRHAIVALLPVGLKKRRDAIKELPVPKPLQSFLNFPEFDIFLQMSPL